MKIKTINNDSYETIESLGVTVGSELFEDIEQHFLEDEGEFEFLPLLNYSVDYLKEHGAEEYSCGDGWDEPITYHLRGDAVSIANSIYDDYTKNSKLVTELQKVVFNAILDEVQAELN